MIKQCELNGPIFGNIFLDYQNIDTEELICYLNIALCGTSNIRFKEKMFYEKLSDALTISEEAFAVLAFENCFQRWMYQLTLETSESESDSDKIPNVLYQKNITRKKDQRETAGKWTDKGFKRYNELIALVKESRNSDWRRNFEEELQKRYIEKADGKLKAYRKRMKIRDDMLKPKKVKVAPENMFDVMTL